MKLTLHVGAHRTATTTLQYLFHLRRARLKQSGVVVWGPQHTRDERLRGLTGGHSQTSLWDDISTAASSVALREAQDDLAQEDVSHLIISEENLLGKMAQNLSQLALYPDVADRFQRLAWHMPSVDCVALCIRRYDHYWSSVIRFRLRKEPVRLSHEDMKVLVDDHRNWRGLICALADAFPKADVLVWNYERLGSLPHLAARALTDLRIVPLPEGRRLNGLRRMRGADAFKPFEFNAKDMPHMFEDGIFTPFDPAQTQTLIAKYAEDIAWLRSGAQDNIVYVDHRDRRRIVKVSNKEGVPRDAG